MAKFKNSTERRKARVRRAVKAGANGRPRLSVFRSSKHIYAQIIDDLKGGTVVAASSMEKPVRDGGKTGANIDADKPVGKLVAERAAGRGGKAEGIERGRHCFVDRVKALADAARGLGL